MHRRDLLKACAAGALAAFGTAPIPSASLFMLAAVLNSVGVTMEQAALIVGFILLAALAPIFKLYETLG